MDQHKMTIRILDYMKIIQTKTELYDHFGEKASQSYMFMIKLHIVRNPENDPCRVNIGGYIFSANFQMTFDEYELFSL